MKTSQLLNKVSNIAIENNIEISNQYEVNRLTSLLVCNNIFDNKISAKEFIIDYQTLIETDIKRSKIHDKYNK